MLRDNELTHGLRPPHRRVLPIVRSANLPAMTDFLISQAGVRLKKANLLFKSGLLHSHHAQELENKTYPSRCARTRRIPVSRAANLPWLDRSLSQRCGRTGYLGSARRRLYV